MAAVTLVSVEQVVIGHEYIYHGAATQCYDCRVKAACLNQREGMRYRIVKLRDVTHDCRLNGDSVRVVEVEPSAPPASVEYRGAIEGSTIGFQGRMCGDMSCEHFELCHPIGLDGGTKIRILKVGEKLNCPMGHELAAVEVAYPSTNRLGGGAHRKL